MADRFPSPLIKCEPSLARRLRFFVLIGFVAVVPSTVVFWLTGFFRSEPATPFRAMNDPNDVEVPTEVDSVPRRELRALRWLEVVAVVVAGLVPGFTVSVRAAAAATAALLAAAEVVVTLFLRVTRWLTFTAPRETE